METEHNYKPENDKYVASELETDRELKKKVDNALHVNELIDSKDIITRVVERQVYLEGTVPSEDQRSLATQCIADIFGISNVVNNITFPLDPANSESSE